MHLKHKVLTAGVGLAIVLGGLGLRSVFAGPGHEEAADHAETGPSTATSVPVETAADGGLGALAGSNVSWSGEILSLSDVSVHPSREGQIAQWYVRLGEKVWAGQSLGRLGASPYSTEIASALAEQAKAIVMARAQAEATAKLISGERERLEGLMTGLERSRDATIGVAKAAQAQQQALIPLKKQLARAAMDRLAKNFVAGISANGGTVSSPEAVGYLQVKTGIGMASGEATNEYREALASFITALRDAEALPEGEASRYVAASRNLLGYSVPTEVLSEETLSELRKDLFDDHASLLEAMKEYKESIASQSTNDAEQVKVSAEAGLELAKQRAELAAKIAELDREQQMADAEVRGAEAAYASIASGIGGQDIRAPRTGIVSAIHKNVGDHVAPEDRVASIGAAGNAHAFVRFKIPSDVLPPSIGDMVTVERPGRALAGVKAKVVGVGTALDENGSYAADAEFIDDVDWPVHASVRVVPEAVSSTAILVPLGAVWKDDQGAPNVWLVMENGIIRPQPILIGRTVGDRIEALEGLQDGNRYLVSAAEGLKTGQSVNAPAGEAEKTEEPAEGGDGHGHSHDE